jgi:subtilase family serine protease
VILVPNSGTSTIVNGDESESDLDLEYAGGTAPGATIIFVYVGNSPNTSVWNSIVYAVDNKTAPIISTSYGDCETVYSPTEYSSMNGVLAQAAAQGQTVVAPSGDSGSTDCSGISGLTIAQQQALAVDFPASSQYATGMGGSEFPAADVATTASNFWTPASGSDIIGSAISYIPEMVWNDDDSTATQLSAGGGGASALTPRPSWQIGVPGIPSGTFRLVPDISLTASPNNAGFLYCSSDPTTKITGSCANGFRDTSNMNLTVAGGTSFDVPMFAGMVAIINQKLNSTGQGVVNPTLYSLAANSATYTAAFHDITSGNNECLGSATLCAGAGTMQFSAGTGYDEASGLGSIDFAALLAAWPPGTVTGGSAGFTLGATNVTVAAGSSGTSTVTVTPQNGYTGTISWKVTSSPSVANACFIIANTTVSGTSAVTAMLTVDTTSTACASAAMKSGGGQQRNSMPSSIPIAHRNHDAPPPRGGGELNYAQAGFGGFAGLLFVGLLGFRSRTRKLSALAGILLLAAMGWTLSGCSSSGSSSSSTTSSGGTAAKGTYTLTVVGTDMTTSSITASTTLMLTIN